MSTEKLNNGYRKIRKLKLEEAKKVRVENLDRRWNHD